jgi:tRNA(Ile)-lysidine synthase
VHLNHRLRGKAADADEKFVAKLAETHGLTLHVERADVAAKAKREKANLEDTARRARYEFFARLIAEKKVDRVAVAHTADDQAETVLAHILRGTGLAGLGGIHPETDTVVRPLLHVRRAELRAYLRSKKQKWREDATNQDTSRLRARIRAKLVPMLEKQFQRSTIEHLVTLAELAREDERFLDWIARERCAALAEKSNEGVRIATVHLLSPWKAKDSNTADAEDTEKKKKRHRTARAG